MHKPDTSRLLYALNEYDTHICLPINLNDLLIFNKDTGRILAYISENHKKYVSYAYYDSEKELLDKIMVGYKREATLFDCAGMVINQWNGESLIPGIESSLSMKEFVTLAETSDEDLPLLMDSLENPYAQKLYKRLLRR